MVKNETNTSIEEDGFVSILDFGGKEESSDFGNMTCQCRDCHDCFDGDCEYLIP